MQQYNQPDCHNELTWEFSSLWSWYIGPNQLQSTGIYCSRMRAHEYVEEVPPVEKNGNFTLQKNNIFSVTGNLPLKSCVMDIICHFLALCWGHFHTFWQCLEGYYPKSTIKFCKVMEFWYKIEIPEVANNEVHTIFS